MSAGTAPAPTVASLLIEGIDWLVTLDPEDRILADAWVWIQDGRIEALGTGSPPALPGTIPRLDGSGQIAVPGLVNTHHHLYQNLARAYTPGNNQPLLPWLAAMNRLWPQMRAADLATATRLGLAELMLSGATTVVDHHYVFPEGAEGLIDAQFEVAAAMGVRFHASRGSMDVASELIGPWAIGEESAILGDTERLLQTWHDDKPGSWRQVVVAPCAATSCSRSLLEKSAALARRYRAGLHTHCGETVEENDFSLDRFGVRPLDYLLDCGWDYDRAWLAHGIHFSDTEIAQLAGSGIGVAHCPHANMRLGSGICRVPELREAGVKVGLGVDGSASSDSGHLLAEARAALYLARVLSGAAALTAREALGLATFGGAELIGRPDLGRVVEGCCGDLALFPAVDLYSSGAENPVDGLLFCQPRQVRSLVVGGNLRIREGRLVDLDLKSLIAGHGRVAAGFWR